jgi:hypothetical protein
MTKGKFFWIAFFIGAQAFLLQVIDQVLAPLCPPDGNVGFGWIAFQAWAMYFLSGLNVVGAVKSFFSYGIGILASVAIMVSGGILSGLGFFTIPVMLLFFVPFVIYFELAPSPLSYVPAMFVGAGVYFGFMSYIEAATYTGAAITELIYCALGLLFGYVTVTFRGWYEKHFVNNKTNGMQFN